MIIQYDLKTYNDLTNSERNVIDYINNNGEMVKKMTISDIAEKSFTSPATVSRAIRKCGISNMRDLRIILSAPQGGSDAAPPSILQQTYSECVNTIERINLSDIIKAVEMIKQANKVYVVGRGATSFISKEFEFQLLLLRINASSIDDSELLLQLNKLITSKDVLVIFSLMNSTKELSIASEYAKANKAKVIVCTCKDNTSLTKHADVCILGHEYMGQINRFGYVSRVPLQIISRTLTEYLQPVDTEI